LTPGGDTRNTPVDVLLRVICGRATSGSVGVLLRVNVGGARGSLCALDCATAGEGAGAGSNGAVGAGVALVGVGGAGKAAGALGKEGAGVVI
jgi:hypothetical protein